MFFQIHGYLVIRDLASKTCRRGRNPTRSTSSLWPAGCKGLSQRCEQLGGLDPEPPLLCSDCLLRHCHGFCTCFVKVSDSYTQSRDFDPYIAQALARSAVGAL